MLTLRLWLVLLLLLLQLRLLLHQLLLVQSLLLQPLPHNLQDRLRGKASLSKQKAPLPCGANVFLSNEEGSPLTVGCRCHVGECTRWTGIVD